MKLWTVLEKTSDGWTYAMDVPGGALIRYSDWRNDCWSSSMVFVQGASVADLQQAQEEDDDS